MFYKVSIDSELGKEITNWYNSEKKLREDKLEKLKQFGITKYGDDENGYINCVVFDKNVEVDLRLWTHIKKFDVYKPKKKNKSFIEFIASFEPSKKIEPILNHKYWFSNVGYSLFKDGFHYYEVSPNCVDRYEKPNDSIEITHSEYINSKKL